MLNRKSIIWYFTLLAAFVINVTKASAANQKIDSLLNVNAGLSESEELVDNLNKISALFESDNNMDSALNYAQKALTLSKKINYLNGKAKALFMVSFCYNESGEWENAIDNLEQAVIIFRNSNDTTSIIGSLLNTGVLYSYGSDLVKGLNYIIEAYNMAEEHPEKFGLSEAYTNIGWYYEYLHEFRSASNYYKKALELATEKGQTGNICMLDISLGYVNIKLGRMDEALENIEHAQTLLPNLEDELLEAEISLLFTTYFLESNQLQEATNNLQKSEVLMKKHNFKRIQPDFYSAKGELLIKQGNYSEALDNLDLGLEYCMQLKKYDIITDIYANKSEAFAKQGQYKQAYQMLHLENESNDLIQPNKIAQVLGEFEHTEMLREQKAQAQLQEKLEEEQNRNTLYRERVQLQITAFASIMLIIVVIILSYYAILRKKHSAVLHENYITINKQKLLLEENIRRLAEDEQKLKQLNATKDKFFSIIAHDLKNPFNVLIGISDLIRTNADIKHSHEFEELVEGMFQTATSGYNLLENLLEWSRTQTHSIEFKPKAFNFCDVLSANETLFKQAAANKQIEISWPENKETRFNVLADYNMINFVIRNLLNNAVKFSNENGKIEVQTSVDNKNLQCVIRDHGIGMDQDTLNKLFKIEYSVQRPGTAKEKGTGLGLILCKEFIEKNGGEIRVESKENEGSSFSFILPLINS